MLSGARSSMKSLRISLLVVLITPLLAQTPSAPSKSPDPPAPIGWFIRADDLSNLRLPGAAPFHLKATFHASPGLDFAKPGKSTIVTGDGTYEETFGSPPNSGAAKYPGHLSRHRGPRRRRPQAPGQFRVRAHPRPHVSRRALQPHSARPHIPELIDKHAGWKIQHPTAGPLQYVRISSSTEAGYNGRTHQLKHDTISLRTAC